MAEDLAVAPDENATSVTQQLQTRIVQGLADVQVRVSGDGGRYQIDVVGECFSGVSRVRRQQLVYACIDELIRAGTVHAVTIRATTLAESAP